MAAMPNRLLLPALLCLAGAACSPSPESAAGKVESGASAGMAVSLVPVRSQALERGLVASGPVTPWEEMQLGVELSGLRVTALHVDVGQRVAKGQLLLELDHRTLDSELRQPDAAHSEAAAGVPPAQANRNRGQPRATDKLISASAFDELRAALVQAQAREATTRAQRDGVQLRRDYAQLRAPDAGIVSRRNVQPGQVIARGTPQLALIRRKHLASPPGLPQAHPARKAPGCWR